MTGPGAFAIRADRPVIEALWPSATAAAGLIRALVLIAVAVLLLAASAKLNLPLPYVPMTLQTVVVLLAGAVYGWRLGIVAVLAYLAVGAVGLPVFAGGTGGLKPLLGPTAGFLLGFVVAVPIAGAAGDRSLVRLLIAMALAHAVILAMGFAWLAYGIGLGPARAWSAGIAPFIAGAVLKTVVGAGIVRALRGLVERRQG